MLLQGSRYLQCQGAVPHRTANLTTTTSSGRWDLEFALTKFITTCVFLHVFAICVPHQNSGLDRFGFTQMIFFLRHVLSTRTETVSAVLKSRCSFILASFIWISHTVIVPSVLDKIFSELIIISSLETCSNWFF